MLRRHFKAYKLLTLLLSAAAAVVIASLPAFRAALGGLGQLEYLGALIMGFFFSYGLTTLPALAVLAIIAKTTDPLGFALFGALGGVLADFLIFHVLRDHLIPDAGRISRRLHVRVRASALRHVRPLAPLLGGIILALPLPDEMAMALFGVSHLRTKTWLLLAFGVKFLGLLAFALAIRGP